MHSVSYGETVKSNAFTYTASGILASGPAFGSRFRGSPERLRRLAGRSSTGSGLLPEVEDVPTGTPLGLRTGAWRRS